MIHKADGTSLELKLLTTDDSCVTLVELLAAYLEGQDWNILRLLVREIVKLCATNCTVEQLTIADIECLGKQMVAIIPVIYGKTLPPPTPISEVLKEL